VLSCRTTSGHVRKHPSLGGCNGQLARFDLTRKNASGDSGNIIKQKAKTVGVDLCAH
jgi:hypothetical protein